MSRLPDPQRSKIALIGISDYEYRDKLTPLPSIRNNLVALEDAFTNSSTGVFLSENCIVADSPDSPKSMMQRLNRAAREAEDVFVAYYAGHGILGWGSKLYLSVRETDPKQLDGTAVPFEWIRDALRESPASVRILILDCCFSGRAIGAMSSDSAALEQIKIAGTTILTSTTANDISHSIPGERYTAFTAELIALLTKPSDSALTLHDLYRPLSAAMARRGLPSPKSSIGDSSGDIVIRRPTVLEHVPNNSSIGNQNYWPYQAPGDPTHPPPPPQYQGPPVLQHQSVDFGPAFTPNPTVSQQRIPSSQLHSPEFIGNKPSSPASQIILLLKRAAPITGLIVLIFSTILAGGVLAVGIAQAFNNQAYNDGVPAYIFTIIFVAAWLIISIFLLAKLVGSHFIKNTRNRVFQKIRDHLRLRGSHGRRRQQEPQPVLENSLESAKRAPNKAYFGWQPKPGWGTVRRYVEIPRANGKIDIAFHFVFDDGSGSRPTVLSDTNPRGELGEYARGVFTGDEIVIKIGADGMARAKRTFDDINNMEPAKRALMFMDGSDLHEQCGFAWTSEYKLVKAAPGLSTVF